MLAIRILYFNVHSYTLISTKPNDDMILHTHREIHPSPSASFTERRVQKTIGGENMKED